MGTCGRLTSSQITINIQNFAKSHEQCSRIVLQSLSVSKRMKISGNAHKKKSIQNASHIESTTSAVRGMSSIGRKTLERTHATVFDFNTKLIYCFISSTN